MRNLSPLILVAAIAGSELLATGTRAEPAPPPVETPRPNGVTPTALTAFLEFHAHASMDPKPSQEVMEALLSELDPGWAPQLRQLLANDLPDSRSGSTSAQRMKALDGFRDQFFWQSTALVALGALADEDSLEAILAVYLDPRKHLLKSSAFDALVRIGRPSAVRATRLLQSKTPQLSGDTAVAAAELIAGVSRGDGIASVVAAMDRRDLTSAHRAALALALTKLPRTKRSIIVFKRVFEATPLDTLLDAPIKKHTALATLARQAVQFYDPTLVPWLLKRAQAIRGGTVEATEAIEALVETALMLSTPADLPGAIAMARKHGLDAEADEVGLLAKQCGDSAACYLQASSKQSFPFARFAAVAKAAALTDPAATSPMCNLLLAELQQAKELETIWALTNALAQLTPDNDLTMENALLEVYQAGFTGTDNLMTRANYIHVMRLIWRLRARRQ